MKAAQVRIFNYLIVPIMLIYVAMASHTVKAKELESTNHTSHVSVVKEAPKHLDIQKNIEKAYHGNVAASQKLETLFWSGICTSKSGCNVKESNK